MISILERLCGRAEFCGGMRIACLNGAEYPCAIGMEGGYGFATPFEQLPEVVIGTHVGGVPVKESLEFETGGSVIAPFYPFQRQGVPAEGIIRVACQELPQPLEPVHFFLFTDCAEIRSR